MSGYKTTISQKGGGLCLETYERRCEIWEKLCIRKYDTVKNLASEFGVSERTIRRDIHIISSQKPIYTVEGRYGGVYVVDNALNIKYFNDKEKKLMCKIYDCIKTNSNFSDDEIKLLNELIQLHTLKNRSNK